MRFRKRSVKLYVYHNRYQELSDKRPLTFFGALFNICYYTGLTLIYTLLSPFLALRFTIKQFIRDLRRTSQDLSKKAANFNKLGWRKSMAVFLLLVVVGWGGLHSLLLAAEGQQLKSRVLGDADLGISSLKAGSLLINSEDPGEAQKHFQKALQNFDQIQNDLETNSVVLNGLLKVVPQRGDADKLTQSAELVTQAASHIATLYQSSKGLKITAQGISGTGDNGESLRSILDEFKIANQQISAAAGLLQDVNPSFIPGDKKEIFSQVQSQINDIRGTLSVAGELADLAGSMLLGQKNILILFENSNELRPTGGFLGTFGAMALENGTIKQLHISSIYDLDGQLHEVINPPRPMYAVNDRWYLRDSNWFADFPTTARKMSEFYQKEGGNTPDQVWALTPSIVVDLLRITGPVTLANYGVTLDSSNFIQQTQVETSINYDKKLNKPKQFLADFFPLFLQKLSSLNPEQTIQVLGSFQKNLAAKEILMYSYDPETQKQLSAFHWSGEVVDTDRDYLSIISANLGGTKTDLAIRQTASIVSHISDEGEIINTVTLTRDNPFPNQDTFTNRSFIRFLVPKGSTLISAEGFSPSPLPDNLPNKGSLDSDVAQWESGMLQNIGSGTLIGNEGDKTFFGNWVVIKGGERSRVTLTYKLPFTISSTDHYSLLFQRQTGVPEYPLGYQLYYPKRSVGFSTVSPTNSDNASSTYNLITNSDLFVGLVMNKN